MGVVLNTAIKSGGKKFFSSSYATILCNIFFFSGSKEKLKASIYLIRWFYGSLS